jgi:predicted RNA binding protein YcfA (HicA-like mRNA interferase family)
MKSIDAKDLEKALLKKGFQKQEGGRHTQYYFYYKNNRTSVRVSVSRGSKAVYSNNLIGYVRKEMKLSDNQQLELFIECTFTEEQYIKHLIESKVIKEK